MDNLTDHDFDDLLSRYLDGRETPEERELLMQLINSGRFDNRLAFSTRMLNLQAHEVHMDADTYNRILNKLRTHQTSRPKTRTTWWLSAAAVFMLAVATSIWLYVKFRPVDPIAQNTHIYKDKQLVKLPDGTTVVLNAGSELTYDNTFGTNTRQVVLKGEGYFDVARDIKHPFIVKAGTLTTTVLGTAFNINAGASGTVVTVTRGSVEVADTQGHHETLKPNQQVSAATVDNALHKQEILATTATQWMDSFLILDNITIEAAAKILSEKYKVNIDVAEPIRTCRIHATFFDGESLDTVLMLMGSLLNVESEKQNNGTIYIKGAGC